MTVAKVLKFDNGFCAHIYPDPDVEQPFRDDEAVRVVVLHRRYIDPAQGTCGTTPNEVAIWERENMREWFTISLFLYDHSGTVYRVGRSNPFACRWDSGRVGIVALRRSEWGSGTEADAMLEEYAARVAADYTSWANGECYGYVLHDASGAECDSCWGFIGIDDALQEAEAAASYQATKVAEAAASA
jgi:hypothetical protein